MTREVYCYVYNNTGTEFYVDSSLTDVWNGESKKGGTAPQSIGATASNQLLFYYHKTTAGTVGDTGKVYYDLGNNVYLVLAFNNPYTQNAYPVDTNFNLCFFYAGITNVSESSPSPYTVACSVTANGDAWSPSITGEITNLTATITINNI